MAGIHGERGRVHLAAAGPGRAWPQAGRTGALIDGGKGIRKAIDDVLGDLAVVQGCKLQKRRNLKDHLPKSTQVSVDRMLREAYGSTSVETARKRLRSLLSWLESNGHEDAAASLREGMEETLTVLKLDLPPMLRRSLATTNAIENTMGTVRRVSRNVKRWRGGGMGVAGRRSVSSRPRGASAASKGIGRCSRSSPRCDRGPSNRRPTERSHDRKCYKRGRPPGRPVPRSSILGHPGASSSRSQSSRRRSC